MKGKWIKWMEKWNALLEKLGLRAPDSIWYIGGSDVLPQPLDRAKEREVLEALKEGDLAAKSTLIEHNLRLVVYIARRFENTGINIEDLISIGTIGLIKAVSTFDYTKGIRFATYASRCIENEILMHFRSNKKTAQDVSISDPIDTDKDGHPLTLMDVIAEDDTIIEDLDLKINAEKLYRYMRDILDDREKEIIEWRYGLVGGGLTQREVAKKLNISRSYVSRIEKKALEKLKKRFDAGDVARPPVKRSP